jgi:hypothetical protein
VSELFVETCSPRPCTITCAAEGYPESSTGVGSIEWRVGADPPDLETKLSSPVTYGMIDGQPDADAPPLIPGQTYAVAVTNFAPCNDGAGAGCSYGDAVGCTRFTP